MADKDVNTLRLATCYSCKNEYPYTMFVHPTPGDAAVKTQPYRLRCPACKDAEGKIKNATLNLDGTWDVEFHGTNQDKMLARKAERLEIKAKKAAKKSGRRRAAIEERQTLSEQEIELADLEQQRMQMREELRERKKKKRLEIERKKKELEEDRKRLRAEQRKAAERHAAEIKRNRRETAKTNELENKQKIQAVKLDMKLDQKQHEREIQEEEEKLEAARTENEKARRELAARELSRRHLIPFTQRMQPEYMAGWVHKDVAMRLERFLEQVINKESPRLMLQMPPRLGKSLLASQMFPAWALGKYPWLEFIQCTYSGSLATSFSRKVRGLLRDDPEYHRLFPKARVDKDNMNAEGWLTTDGGGYIPAGVGGGITGKGAHILGIDDPVKNAEEAESLTVREGTDEWYSSTAYTRLAPGGGVLVIQTRWHLDDLSGRLETRMIEGLGDEFEIVRYPAVAEEDELYRKKGEALHPDRYDEKAYKRIERAVGPRVWSALYQQNPVGNEMAYFDFDGTMVYYESDERPENLTYYTVWDLAVTTKERSDWTVGLVFGVDSKMNIWIVDLVRFRKDSDEIVESILDTHELWDTEMDGIENGHIQLSIGPFLNLRAEERGLYNHFAHPLKIGRRDKEARARPIQAMLKQRRVRVPARAAWLNILKSEMTEFPFNRKNDDCVDALAWIGQMITDLASPMEVKPKQPRREPTVQERLEKFARNNDRRKSSMSA